MDNYHSTSSFFAHNYHAPNLRFTPAIGKSGKLCLFFIRNSTANTPNVRHMEIILLEIDNDKPT